jgi:hypothetical protein
MNEELKVIISAEISDLKKGVAEAKNSIKSFASENIKDMDAFKDGVMQAGDAAKTGLKVAAGAITGVTTALLALGPATAEYRTAQAKLVAGFEAAGSSAEVAKDTYNDLYRVLGDGDVAVEAANHLAKLTTSEEELAEWTNICQGVYASFGDSIPIEGLTEAVNHTVKLGSVQGPLADALEWTGISTDEFNEKLAECRNEEERSALIRDTLTGLYEDAALAYEKNGAAILAQNEAQAKMDAAMATLGETMAPVVAMLTELGAEILADLAPHIQEFADKHLPDIKEALEGVGEKIGNVINFIADNWNIIVTIGGIIAGVAIAISAVSTALGIYNTVMAITAVVSAPMIGIIAAIIAGIALLVAGIILCVKNWDKIKAKVVEVWNKIKDATSKAVSAVVNKFGDLKDKALSKVNSLKTSVVDKFNDIKKGITDKIHAARDAVKDAIEKIKGFFDFKWELPKLKLPTFSMTGKFSLNPPSVPKISINWNALGGIFDKPTVFGYGDSLQGIGEDGAEAVVPLEKNTEWLDRIAERLAAKQGSTPIILQVDGKTFAQTSINTINQLTRQTGKLGLAIM